MSWIFSAGFLLYLLPASLFSSLPPLVSSIALSFCKSMDGASSVERVESRVEEECR